MRFLLINNSGKKLKNLNIFLLKYGTVQELDFSLLNPPLLDESKFDCIVLSGSSLFPVMYLDKSFDAEIQLIKNTKLPIIGICFGAQLIAKTFGNKFEYSKSKIRGIKKVMYKDTVLSVWQNHHWKLKTNINLDVLGKSIHGVEVFKINDASKYGIQFHPENPNKKNDGYIVFEEILKMIR